MDVDSNPYTSITKPRRIEPLPIAPTWPADDHTSKGVSGEERHEAWMRCIEKLATLMAERSKGNREWAPDLFAELASPSCAWRGLFTLPTSVSLSESDRVREMADAAALVHDVLDALFVLSAAEGASYFPAGVRGALTTLEDLAGPLAKLGGESAPPEAFDEEQTRRINDVQRDIDAMLTEFGDLEMEAKMCLEEADATRDKMEAQARFNGRLRAELDRLDVRIKADVAEQQSTARAVEALMNALPPGASRDAELAAMQQELQGIGMTQLRNVLSELKANLDSQFKCQCANSRLSLENHYVHRLRHLAKHMAIRDELTRPPSNTGQSEVHKA